MNLDDFVSVFRANCGGLSVYVEDTTYGTSIMLDNEKDGVDRRRMAVYVSPALLHQDPVAIAVYVARRLRLSETMTEEQWGVYDREGKLPPGHNQTTPPTP